MKPLKYFDAWFGAHQKIDRAALRHMQRLWPENERLPFPTGQQILKFEGNNGPDGIKHKSPGENEPWHFFDPHDKADTKLIQVLQEHYNLLVESLASGDKTRASFEAAWLAHGIVDGLTPAHHYPYEQELLRLRGGESMQTRNNYKEKLLMHGDTIPEKFKNNWGMWGDKGLLATHIAFEYGIAIMIVPLRLRAGQPSPDEVAAFRKAGIVQAFRDHAAQIAGLEMYETFYRSGWTPRLATVAKRQLIPGIVHMVTLAWYCAMLESRER